MIDEHPRVCERTGPDKGSCIDTICWLRRRGDDWVCCTSRTVSSCLVTSLVGLRLGNCAGAPFWSHSCGFVACILNNPMGALHKVE